MPAARAGPILKPATRMTERPQNTPQNPFRAEPASDGEARGAYGDAIRSAAELIRRGRDPATAESVRRQHAKGRMTVWERMAVLSPRPPRALFPNWGRKLDGASLVTAILDIEGRDVAVYGHDFTVRAGAVDATNGRKLARLFELAARRGIPVIGMNDSAGAFVPAGVGGLDGYAEAFTALRKISGVVPSIMCMFGFNAGGGSYLPRQGSFVIQPKGTFFGLTGPGVVKSVLGEDITPDALGGPSVHAKTGVADFVVDDEVGALRQAIALLRYLPDNNRSMPARCECSDPAERATDGIDVLLRRAFDSPTGFNTPVDSGIVIQQLCDHGDYLETQPERARNALTAFGRMDGWVVGFVANNSAVASGQIDVDAAHKIARFVRFCNLYNTPVIFLEDTTGFLPGQDQESRGIVQAGRSMLDSIIDLRTPRFLVIIRNAYGGAYAAFNNYATGADWVAALPSTRVAVMGSAGVEFIYKDELRAIREQAPGRGDAWRREREAELARRYEKELMNPREALALGSISQLVMPAELRRALNEQLAFHASRHESAPMRSVQREFH